MCPSFTGRMFSNFQLAPQTDRCLQTDKLDIPRGCGHIMDKTLLGKPSRPSCQSFIWAFSCISMQWTSPAGDSYWRVVMFLIQMAVIHLQYLLTTMSQSISEEYSIANSESINEEYFIGQKIGGNTEWLYSHLIYHSSISIALSLLESSGMKFWCFPSCL